MAVRDKQIWTEVETENTRIVEWADSAGVRGVTDGTVIIVDGSIAKEAEFENLPVGLMGE